MATILYGHVSAPSTWRLGAGVAIVTNLGAMQLAHPGDHPCRPVGPQGPEWQMVGEVVAARLLWLSLPLSFPTPRSQAPGHLRDAARGPRHCRARAGRGSGLRHRLDGDLHRRLCCALLLVAQHRPVRHYAVDPVHPRRCRRRRAHRRPLGIRPAEDQCRLRLPVESASLLLQEYEQRGVGWLWQVDGEIASPTFSRA